MDQKDKTQQIVIKICCVIVSFILWLFVYNVENPIRERKIVVPVQVINKNVLMQSNIIPAEDDDLNVTLTIKGNASDVYSVKASQFQLTSDLGAYVVKKGENKIPVQINKSPASIRVVNSDNLWVKITIEGLKSKTVPIRMNFHGKAKSGFYAVKPQLSTRQAKIKGAQNVVQKVAVASITYDIDNISQTVSDKMTLKAEDYSGNIIKDVEIEPEYLNVTIPVKRIKSVPVNVRVSGDLSSHGIKSILPVQSNVEIVGNQSEIAGISGLNTETVDIDALGGKDTIDVKVIMPGGVTLVDGGNTIKLKVDIDKNAQKQISLKIQAKNLDSNYTASMSSDTVNIVATGSKDALDNLESNASSFVDLGGFGEGQQTVPVNVSLPDGITKVSQDPVQITVTVKKKNMEAKNGN